MNNIVWKGVRSLNNPNTFNNFEDNYGIKLSEKLKKFIRTNNAGRPNLDIIKTANGEEVEVKALISFNKEDTENIYNIIQYFKKEFNDRIMPIATEPSGDYFCIDKINDSVVYWNHETNKLTFIAKDFNEFLKKLY